MLTRDTPLWSSMSFLTINLRLSPLWQLENLLINNGLISFGWGVNASLMSIMTTMTNQSFHHCRTQSSRTPRQRQTNQILNWVTWLTLMALWSRMHRCLLLIMNSYRKAKRYPHSNHKLPAKPLCLLPFLTFLPSLWCQFQGERTTTLQ